MPRNWLRPRFDLRARRRARTCSRSISPWPGSPTSCGSSPPTRATRSTSRSVEQPAHVGQRPHHHRDGARPDRRRQRHGHAGPVGGRPPRASSIAPVDAPGKDRLLGAGRRHGDQGRLAQGVRHRRRVGRERAGAEPGRRRARSSDTCIGCHAATPDGNSVGFTMGPQQLLQPAGRRGAGAVGLTPTYATPAALATMQTLHGIPAYSPAHWSDGDRVVLLSDTGHACTGSRSTAPPAGRWPAPATPARRPSRPSATTASTSSTCRRKSIIDGRLDTGPADLYQSRTQSRAGGAATPLPGASDPRLHRVLPGVLARRPLRRLHPRRRRRLGVQQPRRRGLSCCRSTAAPAAPPLRLAANDAAACQTALASPGLTNDWPKWSPQAVHRRRQDLLLADLLVEAHRRDNAQLYITAVVVDEVGTTVTYPALYLWNQPSADGNHTPSWDDFAPSVIP